MPNVLTTDNQSEMPKKYWKNLPEADQILPLLIEAPERVQKMHKDAVQAANPKAEKMAGHGAAQYSARPMIQGLLYNQRAACAYVP
ncbi:MAG: hypothetical protein HC843_01420 [Sphingomonadales bacterium]|nr:hypothetical protein [Sphingomonadales bacterium]